MKDEIKEILDYLKDNTEKDMLGYVKDKLLSYEESKLLLDYITNLQEENERLKELNVCVGCNNNPDYKTRIDKAIEFINKLQENGDIEIWREDGYYAYILYILKGEDKQ